MDKKIALYAEVFCISEKCMSIESNVESMLKSSNHDVISVREWLSFLLPSVLVANQLFAISSTVEKIQLTSFVEWNIY